jgi:hypothetical protein
LNAPFDQDIKLEVQVAVQSAKKDKHDAAKAADDNDDDSKKKKKK